ncbi:hypothetical protein [Oceanidesulfovibrio indonesiensis]|uniref:hypothetical protein n=1 Tax=Oceanidesulfovibrio indonesiensis TaxID=54767 RepID=UPI0012946DB6|nr:hypothetical protein [Oceanidesulfovibrio indonesiensis]
MSDSVTRNGDDFGFEIENRTEKPEAAGDEEGLSREDTADILKNFNAIFDNEED